MAYLTKEQVKQILLNAPPGIDKGEIVAELAKTNTLQGYNEPAPKQDGFIKSVAKDAFQTLLVKPGARIGQAAAYGLGAITKDENLKNVAFQDTNINLGALGNYNIEGQRAGVSGVKQVAGDALKTASYLYTPAKGVGVAKAGLSGAIKQGIIQGAKTGAIGGATYSGGQALIDDKSAGQVVGDTLKGGAFGGLTGGILGGAIPLASKGYTSIRGITDPAMRDAKIITKRTSELDKLENSYSKLRKITAQAESKNIPVKKLLAESDLLHNVVDDTGTIRTTNSIADLNDFIKPQEDVISKNLQIEGNKVPLTLVESKLKQAVNDSGLKGGAKVRALRNVADDIEGYALEADQFGNIPVSVIHDAKVDKYANINYLNPEVKRADKAIASGLKQIVEDHTSSVDVKALNKELSQWYTLQNYLEALDGKKVDGGKLGKYFAQTVGAVAGSHFGPLGSVAGAEIAGKLKGVGMKAKFGQKLNSSLKQSEAMQSAVKRTLTK